MHYDVKISGARIRTHDLHPYFRRELTGKSIAEVFYGMEGIVRKYI